MGSCDNPITKKGPTNEEHTEIEEKRGSEIKVLFNQSRKLRGESDLSVGRRIKKRQGHAEKWLGQRKETGGEK